MMGSFGFFGKTSKRSIGLASMLIGFLAVNTAMLPGLARAAVSNEGKVVKKVAEKTKSGVGLGQGKVLEGSGAKKVKMDSAGMVMDAKRSVQKKGVAKKADKFVTPDGKPVFIAEDKAAAKEAANSAPPMVNHPNPDESTKKMIEGWSSFNTMKTGEKFEQK